MILYSLRCSNEHNFDAWFRDGATYDAQSADGEIVCPHCGVTAVTKAPMAPRIGRSKNAEEQRAALESETSRVLDAVREHVETTCDYVGDQFAEEARRIHYQEAEERSIYGEATDGEMAELHEEGVTFQRIPWMGRRDS